MIKHFYVDFLTRQWFFLNSHYHSRWQWCWHSVAKFQKKLWFQNKVNILCTKKNNSLLNLDTTYIIINYHGYEEEIQRGKIQNPILLFYWFIDPECYPLRKLKKRPACKKVTFDATLVLTSHSSSCVRDVHLYFLKQRNGNYFSILVHWNFHMKSWSILTQIKMKYKFLIKVYYTYSVWKPRCPSHNCHSWG